MRSPTGRLHFPTVLMQNVPHPHTKLGNEIREALGLTTGYIFHTKEERVPCDTIQTSSISFKMEATNGELLIKAFTKMGYRMQEPYVFAHADGSVCEYKNGEVTARTRGYQTFDISQLKRNYSTEVVKYTANRFGWRLTEKADGELEVEKQY